MASLKKLAYIFIPVLAILLMSHNTFAGAGKYDPYTCWNIAGQGVQCGQYPISTGDEISVISLAKSNNTDLTDFNTSGHYFVWALRFTATNAMNINLGNGYPQMFDLIELRQDCNEDNGRVVCNVLVVGRLKFDNYNLQLAGRVSSYGSVYEAWSVYFSAQSDYQGFYTLYNYLVQHPSASAQDIASAIENTAEQNTQNAANDSQTAGSSSSQDAAAATSSLISTIGGFVTAVTSASPTNCVINGNMGHLNMGNLDLCANPVPSYIQIIGSIILICAVIPLAIILFNRFIGLFRSFQG